MKLTIKRITNLVVGGAAVLSLAGLLLVSPHARANVDDPFDAAGTFKAKCVACHGGAAEKRFDKTKADDVLVETVMKGRKVEKPPNMPTYEEKGITADQAKALVDYMKSIKQ